MSNIPRIPERGAMEPSISLLPVPAMPSKNTLLPGRTTTSMQLSTRPSSVVQGMSGAPHSETKVQKRVTGITTRNEGTRAHDEILRHIDGEKLQRLGVRKPCGSGSAYENLRRTYIPTQCKRPGIRTPDGETRAADYRIDTESRSETHSPR